MNRSNRSANWPHSEPAPSLLLGVQRVHHFDRADTAAKNAAHADQRLQNQTDHLAKRAGLNAELRNSDHPIALPEAEESFGDQSGRRGAQTKRRDRLPDHSAHGQSGQLR